MNITRMMKLMALGAFAFASPAMAELRAFTNDNGTVIQAELVSHQGGKVTLRRADGKEFSASPSIFSSRSSWSSTSDTSRAVEYFSLRSRASTARSRSQCPLCPPGWCFPGAKVIPIRPRNGATSLERKSTRIGCDPEVRTDEAAIAPTCLSKSTIRCPPHALARILLRIPLVPPRR